MKLIDKIEKYLEEVRGGPKKRKPAFGQSSDGLNYAVQINTLDKNDFFKEPFGRRISDATKARSFMKDDATKVGYVGAKRRSTMAAVKEWVKMKNPSEFYAKWKKDSEFYKEDSVNIYYKD